MEKITFPLTGPTNKHGVQFLFEDGEMQIIRAENRLIRKWNNGRLLEYATLKEEDNRPVMVEWKKSIDLRECKWPANEGGLINPQTGHFISSDWLGEALVNLVEAIYGDNYVAVVE